MMIKQITATAIREYAIISGDDAPIHVHDEAARAAGFKAPIAHGMYMMGLAQSLYLAEHQNCWIQSYRMIFQNPLVQESTACFEYELVNGQIQVTITAVDGEVIASGVFSVKEGIC